MKTKNNDIEYLKKAKELLITIDMINGFVKEGALSSPSMQRIIPRQMELLDEALNSQYSGIVFIRDSHPIDAIEFKTYPRHCIKKTKESELIDEFKKYEPFALEYLKNSTNLIFAPHLMNDLLKFENLEKVRLMGCLSEVCVLNGAIGLRNYFDELNKDVEVMVHPDAIDTFDAPNHNSKDVTDDALKKMQASGIKILKYVNKI